MSGSKKKKQVVGYRYYFGIHMGICRGRPNSLVAIRVGDKGVWSGNVTGNGYFNIDAPNAFGGENSEGGVQGTAIALFGESSQTCPSEISSMHGARQPGFRGVFTLFYDGLIACMNPYPKSWKLRVRHTDSGRPWLPSMATIVLDGTVDQSETRSTITLSGQLRGFALLGTSAYVTTVNATTTYGHISYDQYGKFVYVLDQNNAAVKAIYPGQKLVDSIPYEWHVGTLTGTLNLEIYINGTWADPVLTVGDNYNPVGSDNYGTGAIHAMNPAHILYECFTNKEWGRGLDPNVFLDMASFESAASKLYAEKFGLCLKWSKSESLSNFITMIIDHIGAVIYTNRTTGRITLKLIRGGYAVSELPLFTPETGLLDISENAIANTGSLINEVRVSYHHAVFDEDRMVRTHNIASIQSTGGTINSTSRSYKGVPTPALALRLAQRDLKSLGANLRRITFTLDRRGRNVYPGDVIRISHPAMKIKEVIVRVGKVEDAGITEGRMKITALQDVFGLPEKAFSAPVGSIRPSPNSNPCYGPQRVFELPYFIIARRSTAAELDYFDDASADFGAVCDKGSPLNGSYSIAVRESASTADDIPLDNSYACK